MNKNKKIQISRTVARRILLALKNENCWDAFNTRFFSKTKCINHLQECINSYFRKNSQLVNWNKDSWLDIFDDNYLVESIVFYMQNFNLNKELEEEQEKILKNEKEY